MSKHNLKGVEQLLRDTRQSYADLGYVSEPFLYTSPAFLEAHARLLGLTPAPAKTARVLELGGSYGGNMISQAFYNQEAQFTVIDFSKEQIEQGQKIVAELGLENIKLEHKDILQLDDSLGQFDYIIAHGVYSWVDDKVKEALLSVMEQHLADHGVAYISYNTYPGWHVMDEVRQMMLFANRPHPEASHGDQVKRAKYVASLLGAKMLQYDDLKQKNAKLLGALRKVVSQADYYVGHDHLEANNDPVYFQEMADQWAAHNLAYVCDADLTLSFVDAVDPSMAETLYKLSPDDRIGREQYLDFLLDTQFRKSILVKATEENKEILAACPKADDLDLACLDQFNFRLLFGRDVIESWEEGPVKRAFMHLAGQEGTFTFIDMIDYVGLDYRQVVGRALLEHMIRGGVRFTTNPDSHVAYVSGQVYVPTEMTNFASALVLGEGQGHVIMGTAYNEGAPYINSIDVEIMSLLQEPKNEADILAALEGMPIYDTSGGQYREMTPEEYLPIGISHIEMLGAFKRK